MERTEFLNILYLQRERYSESNKKIGWSLWVVLVSIVTISWMIFDSWQNDLSTPPPKINWENTFNAALFFFAIIFSAKQILSSLYYYCCPIKISSRAIRFRHY